MLSLVCSAVCAHVARRRGGEGERGGGEGRRMAVRFCFLVDTSIPLLCVRIIQVFSWTGDGTRRAQSGAGKGRGRGRGGETDRLA